MPQFAHDSILGQKLAAWHVFEFLGVGCSGMGYV